MAAFDRSAAVGAAVVVVVVGVVAAAAVNDAERAERAELTPHSSEVASMGQLVVR